MKTDSIKDGNYFVFPSKPDGTLDVDLEDWSFVKTWKLMQELPSTGKTKAVGVSNFSIKNIETLLNSGPGVMVPAANQIEIHPQLPQTELVEYCKAKGIVVEAYSPLGSSASTMLSEDAIQKIAAKYDAEPAQLLINWGAARGYCVLPKSANPARIKSNLKFFKLSEEDITEITKISETIGAKRYVLPDFSPFHIFE